MTEMVVHYLLPSGERVSETVPSARLHDHYVEWQQGANRIRVPWGRILAIDETHVMSEAEMVTIRDDMGGVVTA